jgi:K+-sensing histidine kinase KdpD
VPGCGVYLGYAQGVGKTFSMLGKAAPRFRRRTRELQRATQLARELGADVAIEEANDVSRAIVAFANREHATQIVLGEPTASRWSALFGRSILQQILRGTTDIDVHIVQRSENAS